MNGQIVNVRVGVNLLEKSEAFGADAAFVADGDEMAAVGQFDEISNVGDKPLVCNICSGSHGPRFVGDLPGHNGRVIDVTFVVLGVAAGYDV